MIKKVVFLLPVIVVLSLILSGCRLPASTPPAGTPTLAEDFPFPVVTTQPDVMKEIQTQTAIALTTPGAEIGGDPNADAQAGGGVVAPTADPNAQQPFVQDTAAPPAQSPTQAPAVDIPDITRPASYTLQKGEFPFCIARRFDVDIASLLSANGMDINSKPGVGVTLTIPAATWSANNGSRSLRSHPTSYTVQSGETINSIACQFGDVAPEQISAANGGSTSFTAGQTIQIP